MQQSNRKFNAKIFPRMKSIIILGVFLALVALFTASTNASTATLKPFVRSRYSKRWRIVQTTESNVMNNTWTTETTQLGNAASGANAATTLANNAGSSVVDATTIDKPTLSSLSTARLPDSVGKGTSQKPRKVGFITTTEHPRHTVGGNGMPLDYDYYGNGGENEDETAPK